MHLDRLFDLGPRDDIIAHDVFTNRVEQFASFSAALAHVREARHRSDDITDTLKSRSNIVVYYGMGGIGKTALSKALQRSFDAGEGGASEYRVSSRVDFSEPSARDMELMLLRLRACLGRLAGPMPAFDIALAAYWERKHPGEPLYRFLDRRSGLGRLSAGLKLSEQIQEGIDSVLGGAGLVGTIWRAGTLLRDGIVDRVRENRLLQECPYFEALVSEPTPDEARPFLPSLLAWEMMKHQRQSDADAVVFFDTWEEVQALSAGPSGIEDTIGRLVFLMPNVLFVVTGRSRLDWHEPRREVSLKYAGPRRWPSLVDSGAGSQQYLVGYFSADDSESYLCRRLITESGPAIPRHIREMIIRGSGGMPLYLELAAEHFDELSARRESFEGQFGGTLPQLVTRVMRDLTESERQLLRAAALVASFDAELLGAAIPGTRDADISRLVRRSFVHNDRDGWLEFSLHDTLRSSIRAHDEVSGDAWSQREWQATAERIFAYLGSAVQIDVRSPAPLNRSRLVESFVIGLSLAVQFEVALDWLFDVGRRLCDLGQWQVLGQLDALPEGSRSNVLGLASALRGVRRRARGDLSGAEEALTSALGAATVGTYARDWVNMELAEVLVRRSREERAEEALVEIAVGEGAFADRAGHWLAVVDERLGRFGAAQSWALQPHASAVNQRSALSLQGFLLLANAQFDESLAVFGQALEMATASASPQVEALFVEHVAWAAAWAQETDAIQLANESAELSRRLEYRIGLGRSLAAQALSRLCFEDLPHVLRILDDSSEVIMDTGYQTDRHHPLLVRVLAYCVHGRLEDAEVAVEELARSVKSLHAGTHVLQIALWWLEDASGGRTTAPAGGNIDWLNGRDEAKRQWLDALRQRRSDIASKRIGGDTRVPRSTESAPS